MRNKLRLLYSVQQIDDRLDELEELKGDLPGEVERVRSEFIKAESDVAVYQGNIKNAMIERDKTDMEIASLKEKIEHYRVQQMEVKTNKQYDSFTKEIEAAQIKIQQFEKNFVSIEAKANMSKVDSEKLALVLPALHDELEQLEQELQNVSSENLNEEQSLKDERTRLIAEIEEENVQMYERIRKAKNGRAAVPIVVREEGKTKKVKEGTCGGCYHRIHPERLVELRQLEKMFTCEHCGRILIPSEVVESTEPLVQ